MRHVEFGFAACTYAMLLCLVTLGLLMLAWRRVRETTLVSAWCWSIAAIVGLALAVLAAALWGKEQRESLDAIWFAAAAATFCPVISVIGSKRPQHNAWNFIVLSLWAIVALPAVEMLALQRAEGLEVNDARGWFLWLLVMLSAVNYLPTRYWFASLAVALGQILLLQSHLPLLRRQFGFNEISAISLITLGAVGAYLVSRRTLPARGRFDRLWLDFRNSFGLLWGLRVQERMNAFIEQEKLPYELKWEGFRNRGDYSPVAKLPKEQERMLRQTLSGLLRRFVSNAWIATRSADDLD